MSTGEGKMTEASGAPSSPPGLRDALEVLQQALSVQPQQRRESLALLLGKMASDPQPHWVPSLHALLEQS